MSMPNVLIVEDDPDLREAIEDTLTLSGFSVSTASNAEECFLSLGKTPSDIIVSDINLGEGLDGHHLLKSLKKRSPEIPVLLMTAYSNVQDAVSSLKNGAADYLIKPFKPEILIERIQQYTRGKQASSDQPVAVDANSKRLLDLAKRVAQTDVTVMISGPSGAGKEVLAGYIHASSARADEPFVAINCAAIPENMLESTLFGYEKGAFTGAHQANPGKFEQAQKGTILLDEISEMALPLQAKLLRVLQEKEVERLGGKKTIQLDVRVIATSNRNMLEEVKNGNFREDLYYRLNVFPLQWIPLAERKPDIVPMAEHLLARYSQEAKSSIVPVLTDAAKDRLENYDWPGNIREMANVLQRALILKTGDAIEAEDLHLTEHESTETKAVSLGLEETLREHEWQIIQKAIKQYPSNREKAAKSLGISPRTLRHKLSKMKEEGVAID